MERNLSPAVRARILKFQRDEITGSLLYKRMAARQKNEANKAVLLELASAEYNHYEVWKGYSGQEVAPSRLKLGLYRVLSVLLGDTFAFRLLERGEEFGANELRDIVGEIPEAQGIIDDEEEHEERLMLLVDEERLHYIGSIVLGLNDALVELTGTIAGLTFALADTHIVALSGIITGVSATLSMAASNFLAQRAEGNGKAFKSSLYTGLAYLITVALMVLPYLLFPSHMYVAALATMLAIVVTIIALFNYYVSVAQSLPFLRRFGEMALISLGVAAISFVIGLLAKSLLGIDI